MAATQAILSAYQDDQQAVFRVQGWARAPQGLALRRAGERCLAAGVRKLRVDLRDCLHMDSTFLGTLLHLKCAVSRTGGDFCLVSPTSACSRLLDQMGLDDVFPTINEDSTPGHWETICCDIDEPNRFKCQVIEAHQALAELPGKAGEPFRQVVHGLMQDAKAREAKP